MTKQFNKFEYLKRLHGADLTPSEYRVLVTVFDYTNAEGKDAWPGIETLVQDCCLSASTVKRCLSRLELKQWLHLESRGRKGRDGIGWHSRYSLSLPTQQVTDDPMTTDVNGSDADSQEVKPDVSMGHLTNVNGSPMTPGSDPRSNPLTDPDQQARLIVNLFLGEDDYITQSQRRTLIRATTERLRNGDSDDDVWNCLDQDYGNLLATNHENTREQARA